MSGSTVTVDEQTLRDLLDNAELMSIGTDLHHVHAQVDRLRREIDGEPEQRTATIHSITEARR